MKDLSQMMDGMLDLNRRNQLPDRERAICLKLLLRITLKVSHCSGEWVRREGRRGRETEREEEKGRGDRVKDVRRRRGEEMREGRLEGEVEN